ncbi:hypothetical protein AMTR_s00048p00229560 [Amborella trichopoda]|uniref:Sugar phosphate transporter domain-containing protein n=2 Tax=Amborella trichopoda TaxID=13333 RepID=U5D0D9_AMBTC|nr:hypothetical protein AMTR_s00048p00229560 [Amborella trichopoda]
MSSMPPLLSLFTPKSCLKPPKKSHLSPNLPKNPLLSHQILQIKHAQYVSEVHGLQYQYASHSFYPQNYSTKYLKRPKLHIPRASASSDPITNAEKRKGIGTLKLGLVFGLWYLYNVIFNIYNKKVLILFPYPWFLASFQLFTGSLWMLFLWFFKFQPCPTISKGFILALLGPAFFHTVGHISACVSLSRVAVSFTHVIKSSEPVFSVVFSAFLGERYPFLVWLSLFPIVFGCSLAAITELSFNLQGFYGAVISNIGFVLRNIYSKKSLGEFKDIDGLNLYGVISILSFFYLFPVSIVVEGSQWVEGFNSAVKAIGKPWIFLLWVLISGVFYHLYNQSSYEALDEISPLSFSVGNTMKRVVVIVASLLVFRNPIRPLNALGSAVAILGTFLYSQATQKIKAKR